jgi:malate dehydrogenase (oxaloacetate-decarboxylating)(NADP+)
MEVASNKRFEELAQSLWEARSRKGFTLQKARQRLRNPTWFGCMLVKEGIADGLVGGLMTPYADTVRPALTVLGKNPDVLAVSGVYVMLMKKRTMFFGDCTVNVDPDAETLAQIAINTAGVARSFGVEPRVAMLSFSDFGDHREMSQVAKVRRAIEIIREREPTLIVDGEVQADTAVDPVRAEELFPFSPLKGRANVLIFPNLAAGNISYKLLSQLGGATAIGPLLVGVNKPVNALALGSDVKDIVNIAALTVTQAMKQSK